MRIRARASRTSLRAPLVWGRHLGLDSNDVFLASYPRSGNTLLRFPLAEAISGALCTFENVQRIVPEIGVHVYAYPLLPAGGRLIKTHERYRRKYRRAIYIVRDVRDVLLSSFARESAMDLAGLGSARSLHRAFHAGKNVTLGRVAESHRGVAQLSLGHERQHAAAAFRRRLQRCRVRNVASANFSRNVGRSRARFAVPAQITPSKRCVPKKISLPLCPRAACTKDVSSVPDPCKAGGRN